MDITELNKDQLDQLREQYFDQLLDTGDEEVLGNYTEASQIPIENIIAHYEGIDFVEDDFWCNS